MPNDIGNRLSIGPITDNTDLDSRYRNFLNQNVRLSCNNGGIHRVDSIDPVVILNGQCGNDGKRMRTRGTDGLDIGLYARTPTGIEPGKNKHTWT